jgi:hypothetical protein
MEKITQLSTCKTLREEPNHRAEGETELAIVTRKKVHLSVVEWQMIKAAVNHGAVILANSMREVLMGYQYALHLSWFRQ